MENTFEGIGILAGILGIFLFILAVLWFILPFAIFGIKERLDPIIHQLKNIAELLRELEKED